MRITDTIIEESLCVSEALHDRVEETGVTEVSHPECDSASHWLVKSKLICFPFRNLLNASRCDCWHFLLLW
jgi:hypothetical protein